MGLGGWALLDPYGPATARHCSPRVIIPDSQSPETMTVSKTLTKQILLLYTLQYLGIWSLWENS